MQEMEGWLNNPRKKNSINTKKVESQILSVLSGDYKDKLVYGDIWAFDINNGDDKLNSVLVNIVKRYSKIKEYTSWFTIGWILRKKALKDLEDTFKIVKELSDAEIEEKKNKWKVTWEARIQKAEELLGRTITKKQRNAILKSHYEIWRWKGIFEYNDEDIMKKWLILKKAWFTADEIRTLIEKGICGYEIAIWGIVALVTLGYFLVQNLKNKKDVNKLEVQWKVDNLIWELWEKGFTQEKNKRIWEILKNPKYFKPNKIEETLKKIKGIIEE